MSPDPDPRYLFVYGTLMRASRSPYARLLRARAQFVGEGWTPGRLYHLGRYPGAVFGDDCAGRVYGELFLLRGGTLLAVLDAYERCSGQGEKPDLFYRDVAKVQSARPGGLRAWVYPFAGMVRGRPLIASGRFLVRPAGAPQ
jgi:gamma-glutamylcyclotransferase (GGCT)/AIG2-like uncharacterized protein YtfP